MQKKPSAAVFDAVPVVSGFRLTGSGAWNPGRLGRQSFDVSLVPTAVQVCPVSGLVVFVFVFHVESQCAETHFGHGEPVLPVM